MESQRTEEPRNARCVWVLAASPVWTSPERLTDLPRPDVVIAADGGSTLAARLGLVPDLVIGDLDSSDPDLVQELEAGRIRFDRFQHETKLETDTELAVLAALEWQPDTILVLGAIGGRLDHSVANLLLLTHPQLVPHDVRLVDGKQVALLAKPGLWNSLPASAGDTVSLLPVGGEASGVVTSDLLYPLNSETLLVGRGRGVSNEVRGPQPRVFYEQGLLMVIVVRTGRTREETNGTDEYEPK
ncbi:MAG: thiamine diphosphokinase [Chloroflexota bacterium]|nr:thiamine diphosphokinase [Chloroflexota bacterium]